MAYIDIPLPERRVRRITVNHMGGRSLKSLCRRAPSLAGLGLNVDMIVRISPLEKTH